MTKTYSKSIAILPIATASLLFYPQVSYAEISDIHDVLSRLRDTLPNLILLLLIISYVLGIGMIIRGLALLKAFGMPLTQASRPGEIGGPLVYILVGTVLVFLPTTSDTLALTVFSDATVTHDFVFGDIDSDALKASVQLVGYAPGAMTVEDQWKDLIDTIILYVQFVGFIAFVRGWIIMSHAGQPGVQPGTISRGVVHLLGGILAINFIPVVQILRNTLFGS